MKKTLLAGFILIALSLSFSIAQANFSVLYDWIWGPKEEIKKEAEDPTVGFVYNPAYFKKLGNDIQIINSSWGFIVGNATTTGTSDLATTTVSGDFTVQTSDGVANLYVDNNTGNVGIGTASPDELLHVDGTVQTGAQVNIVAGAGATAFLDFKADSGTNANDIAYISKVNNGNFVFSNDNNHGFQGFVIDVSGNVGIGTTEPAAPLHILSELASDNVGFRIGKEALDEYFFAGIDVTGNNIAYIGSAYGNDANRFDIRMKGFAATDAKLTVLGDGNVGIGLTGPSAQCHIDQSSGTGAKPVLTLDQGDVSEEFIKLIGTSAVDNTQSFVDATDLTTPGNIMGWIRVYIQDDAASGAISDGIYFVPFYSTPTA